MDLLIFNKALNMNSEKHLDQALMNKRDGRAENRQSEAGPWAV